MGKSSKSGRKYSDDSETPSSSSSSASDSESDSGSDVECSRRRRRRHRSRDDEKRSSRRDRERRREKEKSRKRREKRKERDRKSRKGSKRRSKREAGSSDEDGSGSSSDEEDDSEPEIDQLRTERVVKDLLKEFPGVVDDLTKLLQMIDAGQAVDISGISEKSLMKRLKKLFRSLALKEKTDGVFLLRPKACPTLVVVGPMMPNIKSPEEPDNDMPSAPPDTDAEKATDDGPSVQPPAAGETAGPKRRVVGPEMPSAELLAAAAKLTEAQAELREAELDDDDGILIGPAPPAVVSEAASANEAERFEEVTRIMGAEDDSPYDVVGVNHNMPIENIKKRYWKLSLMVHPDKCSHPQAQQAFVKLNKSFKDLQDPDKRKAMDDKIKKKEEEEQMKVELRSMREAALWRRSQGISIEGDDILLAETEVKEPPKRDEWMTTLPPERKPGGMPMHSTYFSKTTKEGRGDTSAWTDTPSDRAQKAKMNYLEAFNQAAALAANEDQKKNSNADADLVDQYNKAKRSKTLVEKHKEEVAEKSRAKKKSKRKQVQQPKEKEEWSGMHPWKPWDREKDLTAGRQNVKLDSDNMKEGLTSRFSSGAFQRSFL